MKHDYDILIIGGGSAGLTGAKLAPGLGMRVHPGLDRAMVDSEEFGMLKVISDKRGTILNATP